MAITRLERKGRKNKNVAKKRVNTIKRLSKKPVIKNVDLEAIKSEFDSKPKAKSAKAKKEEVAVEQEVKPVEEKVEKKAKKEAQPKAEKAEKKPKAKKEEKAPKKEDKAE